MQAHKLSAAAGGLVPAGAYFAEIAAKLEDMNRRESARQDALDEEDRELEALHRKRSAVRVTRRAQRHALM